VRIRTRRGSTTLPYWLTFSFPPPYFSLFLYPSFYLPLPYTMLPSSGRIQMSGRILSNCRSHKPYLHPHSLLPVISFLFLHTRAQRQGRAPHRRAVQSSGGAWRLGQGCSSCRPRACGDGSWAAQVANRRSGGTVRAPRRTAARAGGPTADLHSER
jgi:hypothetical protein